MLRRLLLTTGGILAGTALGAAVGLGLHEVGGRVERATIDARFALRGERAPDPVVVIVAYDNRTLQTLGVRPPVPRSMHARVLDALDEAGARVVALDYSLEQSSGDEAEDRALTVALMNARAAVVSVVAPEPDGSVAALAGFLPFADTGVRAGYTPLSLDPQGVVRTFARPPGALRGFGVAAAEAFGGRPLRPPANAVLDFAGSSGTYPSISYVDVLNGRFDPAAVRGKLIVIGSTATVLDDQHRVPVDSNMPGPEIHANEAATALAGFPLRMGDAPRRDIILAALLVPLLAAALRGRARGVAWLGVAVALAWLVAAQVLFSRGTIIEVIAPLGAIAASTVATAAIAARSSALARRRARGAFAADEDGVVEQVLAVTRRPRELTSSDVIAGYTIIERIGGGGMGVVYRALHHRLQRQVALKVIRVELDRDAEHRRRFVAEAHRAAAVTHPNVMPILDAGQEDGVLFITMPLIRGTDLGRSLANPYGVAPAYAVALVHRVAAALDAAHRMGVVHRDVKPSNVLIPHLTPQHPYLTDFGIAAQLGERGAPSAGTVAFMAPERFHGHAGDATVDVYSLAAVLFECLTGTRAFPTDRSAAARAHAARARPSVVALRPDLPIEIDAVIARGLAVDPTDRYPRVSDLTRAAAMVLRFEVTDDVDDNDDLEQRVDEVPADTI